MSVAGGSFATTFSRVVCNCSSSSELSEQSTTKSSAAVLQLAPS
jgi:hypothetical protein